MKEYLKKCIDARHYIHQHPELSCHETKTKDYLINFIKTNTKLEIHDMGRWFYAVYRSGNNIPGVMFRAEMDAIPVEETNIIPYVSLTPGVGHKCGHDGHAAALLCAAIKIEEKGAARDVYFLFQHAEETGEGAPECVDILENDIGSAYGFHNWPGVRYGTVRIKKEGTLHCASKGLIISLKGKPTHAATPELGINPAFAAGELIQMYDNWIKAEKYRGMVLCTIVEVKVGERAFGTSPGSGEIGLTIRSEFAEDIEKLQNEIINSIEEVATKYDLKFNWDTCDEFPVTSASRECTKIIENAAERCGLETEFFEEKDRASDDFGWYSMKIPGAMFYIGDGEDYPELHSSEFDFPDDLVDVFSDIIFEIAQE